MPTLTDVDDVYFSLADAATPQLIDNDVTFIDAEGDFDGGTLLVSGVLAEDIIGLRDFGSGPGEVGVVGTDVFFAGVLIGSFAGGAGADFTVTFNGAATTGGVKAVIEALTYQNLSGVPTQLRDLSITVTDAAGNSTVRDSYLEAATQPFAPAFSVGDASRPTLGDLDGDGDLDLVVGDGYGNLHYLENVGTTNAPDFVERTGAANPFDSYVGDQLSPALVDLDGDADLDLVVGMYNGTIRYLRNDGSAVSPVFNEQTGIANPFAGIDIGSGATPAFADLDGDGDLDLSVGRANGYIAYFENTGSDTAPAFTERTGGDNPFDAFLFFGGRPTPTFVDLDGDGDFDVALGFAEGPFSFLENIGTVATPIYGFTGERPFSEVMAFFGASGAFGDLDGDGVLELVLGSGDGSLVYYEVAPRPAIVEIEVEAVATAANDLYKGREDAVIVGSVFANNGSGADSAGAIVIEVNGEPADVGQQIELPSGALLTLNANGTFSYDPNGAFDYLPAPRSGGSNKQAEDNFSYTVNGGDTALVTIRLAGVDTDDVVIGTAGNDQLNGGEGDDVLEGGDGNDYLRGEAGADRMLGGMGDDIYVVDDIDDIADETDGDGIDLVISRVSWTLGADIENLTLGVRAGAADGTGNELANLITGNAFDNTLSGQDGEDRLIGGGGNDVLLGGDGDDVLEGGGGHDRLEGGAGGDVMTGGAGNDVYVIDNANDSVIELAGGGTDTIGSSLSITNLDNYENVEHLVLIGSAVTAQGTSGANVIIGNAGANDLYGMEGNDTLYGGDGNDYIVGGEGADRTTGGLGADAFAFLAGDLNGDRIMDLNFAEGDAVDLSEVYEGTLSFVSRFTKHAGEITLIYNAGQNLTWLRIDLDGDGKVDESMSIVGDVSGTTGNLYVDDPEDTNGGWIL